MKNLITNKDLYVNSVDAAIDVLVHNDEIVEKSVNILANKISKLESGTFWLSVCLAGAGYCIYKLQEALDKSNAQIFALQSHVDALEIEKQVKEG